VSQKIARAQLLAFQPARIGLMIAGLEVPHLHLHLVPMDGVRDLDFANAAVSVDRDDLEDAASSIRYILRSRGHDEVAG
jgi:histidine triad (HIT) family protein